MSPRAHAAWTAALLLGGTFLAWIVFVEAAPRALGGLLLGGLAVFAWWRGRAGWPQHVALIAGAALLAGLAGPLARPHGEAGVLRNALFSSQGGLFFWSPSLWLGVAGLLLLARRQKARAAVLALAAVVFVMVAAVLAEPRVSPGAPRFAPLLAFLAPGVAEALRALTQVGRRRPGLVLTVLGACAVLSNFLLMHQYRAGWVPRDDTVSFSQVAESSARLVSDSVGTPLAWPANWIWARRESVPVGRADLLLGAQRRDADIDIGALDQDAALLFEGWSVRRPCAPEICREVEGRARLLAPLGPPETLDVTVRAAGAGVLTVELNGVPIAHQDLTEALHSFSVRVPAARLRAPLNEVVFVLSPGGRALVDRLAFTRPPA